MNEAAQKHTDRIVIRYGGSILVPDKIDLPLLKRFESLLRKHIDRGVSFVVIIGGGATSKYYQETLAKEKPELPDEEIHWIGIHTIQLNAEFVRRYFHDIAAPKVYKAPHELDGDAVRSPLIIAGAESPGHSSNIDAVEFAHALGAKDVLNLSNISHVYSEDPRHNPDAEKFTHLTFTEYKALIPEEFTPKLAAPFDPVATRRAEELGLSVIIMDGHDIDAIDAYLTNGEVTGTIIKD